MPTKTTPKNHNPALDEFSRKWGFAQVDSPWGINSLCLIETQVPFRVLHGTDPRALALRMMGAVKARPAQNTPAPVDGSADAKREVEAEREADCFVSDVADSLHDALVAVAARGG